jgi:hypothetical protein
VDITAWLRGLGLQEHEQVFRDNEIDAAVLPELTADHLRDFSVSLAGRGGKLLAAIAALRNEDRREPAAERRELIDTATVERRQLRSRSGRVMGKPVASCDRVK